jgi:DNA-binding response OmpR family regulator
MCKINVNKLLPLSKELTILYVEDDHQFHEETSEILEDLFKTTDTAYDGIEALDKYKNHYTKTNKYYDLIITDINMPHMDGIALTKKIYAINKDQHIIIVSAHNESHYLMDLVNLGVDHFLLKPFTHHELLEVLYNSLKKSQPEYIINLGSGFTWDKTTEVLKKDNIHIKLTTKEHELIKLFIKNSNKISSTQEIFNHVWYDDYDIGTTDSLKALLSRLRKKIKGVKIESIYNLGYRLNF